MVLFGNRLPHNRSQSTTRLACTPQSVSSCSCSCLLDDVITDEPVSRERRLFTLDIIIITFYYYYLYYHYYISLYYYIYLFIIIIIRVIDNRVARLVVFHTFAFQHYCLLSPGGGSVHRSCYRLCPLFLFRVECRLYTVRPRQTGSVVRSFTALARTIFLCRLKY